MKSNVTALLGAFLALGASAIGISHAAAVTSQTDKPKPAEQSRFDKFAALKGEWVGTAGSKGTPGDEVHVIYKLTSGNSAVVETIFPDTDHEMITIIHRDGDDVELTHYCAMGNQPHMKVSNKGTGNVVAFKFTHATNMKSEKDTHMHNVTYTFVDKDTLSGEWTSWVDGKPAGGVVFKLKRKG